MNDNQDDPIPQWEDGLSQELWLQIFSWVEPLDLLRRGMRVSKGFRSLLEEKPHWELTAKAYLAASHKKDGKKNLPLQGFLSSFTTHQLQKMCIIAVESRLRKTAPDYYPAFLKYGPRLVDGERAQEIRDGPFRTCLASSTEHSSETLENVLPGQPGAAAVRWAGIFLGQGRWWSSRPSTSQESDETLLFVTDCPLASLTRLDIRPLLDPFNRQTVYSWKAIVVRAYQLPPNKVSCPEVGPHCVISFPNVRGRGNTEEDHFGDEEDLVDSSRDNARLEELLCGEIPVWESDPQTYMGPNRETTMIDGGELPWQTVIFPDGVVANTVTITLLGKNNRQFDHSGYYTCVDRFQFNGIPI